MDEMTKVENFLQMTIKFIQGSLVVFEKKSNACSPRKQVFEKLGRAISSIPNSCPVSTAMVHCFKNEKMMTLSDSQGKIVDMYGKFKYMGIQIEIEHDTGNSCIYIDFEIVKKEKS
jgi:hypothetical protein